MQTWQQMRLSPGDNDLCELFHENSKISRISRGLSDREVWERMKELHESLVFTGFPSVRLPRPMTRFHRSLSRAITTRRSARNLAPCPLTLKKVATLLHYSYGITRHNKKSTYPRPFRVVPSGGALYPLELFFHTAHVKDLSAGLYHYNPSDNNIRLIRAKDETAGIAKTMVYPELAAGASLIVFITAIFERSVFKYGARGYRFVLIEAGHVAQNINLVSNCMRLGSVNIGGFFDREVDDFLGLDGVTQSVVYIIACGKG